MLFNINCGICSVGLALLSITLVEKVFGVENDVTKGRATRAKDSLQLIIVVSRHGNRAGIADYPSDLSPVSDTKLWPYGPLQLTSRGRAQAYNLGKRLRTLYNGFLPSLFRSEDMYASSTPLERSAVSGQLVLAGIYPPVDYQVWNENMPWQPIPLYTNITVIGKENCPRYFEEIEKVAVIRVSQEQARHISEIISYVYEVTKVRLTTKGLILMADKLISEENEGFTLPEWVRNIYPDRLKDLYSKTIDAIVTGSESSIRIIGGSVYNEMFEIMKRKVKGSLIPDRRLFYYSGHDITILSLAAALRIPRGALPLLVSPGSALVLELHRNPGSTHYSVQMVYIDGLSEDSDYQELPLPQCGVPCEFQTLVDTTERYSRVNYDKECQLSGTYSVHPAIYQLIYLLTVATLLRQT